MPFGKENKMKKILSRAIVPALAFVLCLGLSSCSFIGGCDHRDADDDFKCDACGDFYTDGKDEKVCQHRDADDNAFCDSCGASFTDGEDVADTTPCQHRDRDDNARCDLCGVAFTDGKDDPPAPTCRHRDENDDSLCDKCGASFDDGSDAPVCQHRDADDNSLCDYCEEFFTDEKDIHYFGEWIKGSESEESCEMDRFARTCSDCGAVEYKFGGFENHTFKTEYFSDTSFHWYACERCDAVSERAEHEFDQTDYCSVCNALRAPTEGLIYSLSDDGVYATVIGYNGNATKVILAEKYQNAPVTAIGKEAFKNTSVAKITIPTTVTEIGESAFCECASLVSVTLSDSVVSIGDRAFQGCISLVSVSIGSGVNSIGKSVFYSCDKLENIFVSEENGVYKDVSGNLYTKDGKVLIQYAEGKRETSFEIPNGTEKIADEAFLNAINLTSITVADSVKEIGEYAFSNCAELKLMILGKGVTRISAYAFIWCRELEAVYYTGTKSEWKNVNVDPVGNTALLGESFYVYSETPPYGSSGFWHYVDNVPNPWPDCIVPEAPGENEE